MAKTDVIYDNWNSTTDVAFVVIQAENDPPYVWACYNSWQLLPTLGADIVILPIKAARKLFDFKKGKLSTI